MHQVPRHQVPQCRLSQPHVASAEHVLVFAGSPERRVSQPAMCSKVQHKLYGRQNPVV